MVVTPPGNVKMGKKLVVGAALFSKGMYGIVAGNQPGPEYIVISADSLAARSASPSSIFGTTSIPTSTTGVKASFIFACAIPSMTLFGDVWVQIPWRVSTGSAGTPLARINLDVLKNGNSFVSPAHGVARDISGAATGTEYVEYLHVQMGTVDFGSGAGDLLQFSIEIEVTTASGSGGSTAEILLHHDPETAGKELIVEVIV